MEIEPIDEGLYELRPTVQESTIMSLAVRRRLINAATGLYRLESAEAQSLANYLQHTTARNGKYKAYPHSLNVIAGAVEDWLPDVEANDLTAAHGIVGQLQLYGEIDNLEEHFY